eukprot:241976-Chlamydomonas_euryale.AAC.1
MHRDMLAACEGLGTTGQGGRHFTQAELAVLSPSNIHTCAELRDFKLGGVSLEGERKERFNAIQQELTQLSTSYSNNVLDGTKAFKRLVTDAADVDGLPSSALGLAAQQAKAAGHESATPESGPWLFTLDFPSYYPVLTHCKNRALREEMYTAYMARARCDVLGSMRPAMPHCARPPWRVAPLSPRRSVPPIPSLARPCHPPPL